MLRSNCITCDKPGRVLRPPPRSRRRLRSSRAKVSEARDHGDQNNRRWQLPLGRTVWGANYIWITKDGYAVVGMPEMPTCDNCNQILQLTTDMSLDAEVVRRGTPRSSGGGNSRPHRSETHQALRRIVPSGWLRRLALARCATVRRLYNRRHEMPSLREGANHPQCLQNRRVRNAGREAPCFGILLPALRSDPRRGHAS